MDTPSLCLYGIFSCFKAYEYWHVDYLVYILHVPYYILILVIMCACIYLLIFVCICFVWLHVAWLPFFFMIHVWLLLFIGYIDMLITSIDSLTYFRIVTLLVVWLSCFPGHVYSHFCISRSYWCDWFSLLYIILFISTYCLFLLYTYLAYHILAWLVCRYEWYTCYLHDYLVHDCYSSMWCMYYLFVWDTHLSP